LDCETLSAQISGDTTDEFILERARVAARAQLDLARIRQIKTAMLNRAYAFGTQELQQRFRTTREVKLFLGLSVCTEPPQPPVTMSLQGPERVAEVVQRLIPELHKLNGYERRAWVGGIAHCARSRGEGVECDDTRVALCETKPNSLDKTVLD